MTEPATSTLTIDERIRRAAGRPVASVEERILEVAWEPHRRPEPAGGDVLRVARAAAVDGQGERRPVPSRLLVDSEPEPPARDRRDDGARNLERALDELRGKRARRGSRLRRAVDERAEQHRFGF